MEGKRRSRWQGAGGGCLRTRSRAVSSATLVCRGDDIVFSLLCPSDLSVLPSSPSLSGLRVDSMILSSGTKRRDEARRVAHTLIFTLTSFRDVFIDFIFRSCIAMIQFSILFRQKILQNSEPRGKHYEQRL